MCVDAGAPSLCFVGVLGAPLDPIYALLKKGSVPRFQFLGRLVAPFGELAGQALRRVPRTERAKEEVGDSQPCFLLMDRR